MEKGISLFILGDFYPNDNIASRLDNFDVFDSSNDWLTSHTKKSDICVVNLECPITKYNEVISKTGPALNGGVFGLKFLKKIGCNLVTTANNHIMDYGKNGLEDTLDALNAHELDHTGSGLNIIDSKKIKYIAKNKLRVAILNFAENEWSTAIDENDSGASSLNEISNFYDIQQAKKNADKIIVITHGGNEMYNLPSPRLKKLLRFFVDAGADAVINHHTHCVSGYEIYKDRPIFYSVGNFVFERLENTNLNWNLGMGVKLIVSKNDVKFDIIYFKQCIDSSMLLQELSEKEEEQMRGEITRLNEIIACDSILKREFDRWVMKNIKQYNSYLEPSNIRILSLFQNLGYFPSLWSTRKRKYLLNLIRCEAHREMVISILNNENSNS